MDVPAKVGFEEAVCDAFDGKTNLRSGGGDPKEDTPIPLAARYATPHIAQPKMHQGPYSGSKRDRLHKTAMWLWVKNRYPKWNPGKWEHGPKPEAPWFNFDPYPCRIRFLDSPKWPRCARCFPTYGGATTGLIEKLSAKNVAIEAEGTHKTLFGWLRIRCPLAPNHPGNSRHRRKGAHPVF